MAELGIRVERQNGQACLLVVGELDVATAPALLDAVGQLLATGEDSTLVVDLTGVEFLDSSGLGALLQARAEAIAAGGQLTLTGVALGPRRVITIAGLAGTFGLEG
jgi:anti-sigma B factor antagonist